MVLLGFLDEPKAGKNNTDDDPSNWTISRIGGQPAFPSEQVEQTLKLVLSCSKCQREQIFVCQLYCPLDGHRYDRAIYLYACRNPSCWNSNESWRAIRCQKFDETVEESVSVVEDEPKIVSGSNWCDDADAWNSDEEVQQATTSKVTKSVPLKDSSEVTMLDSMSIEEKDSSSDDDEIDLHTKKKSSTKNISVASSDAFDQWKKQHLQPVQVDLSTRGSFPFYYIDIDDEQSIINEAKVAEMKKLKNSVRTLNGIDEDDEDDEETGKRPKEKYEKTPDIEHGDVVFYRFQQKIRYAPEQVIRYDWSGQPLILTKLTGQGLSSVEKCRHCQSPCNFEFQLMPALVNFLKINNQIAVEFGTLFVYTCSKNCWNDQEDLYRLENVFVQADPDQSLFD